MTSPSVNVTIVDPGAGTVAAASTTPLLMGCCSSSTVNTVQSFNSVTLAKQTLGEGPLAEIACMVLQNAGGPVKCMRLASTTAGAAGAVTKTGIGSSTGTITVAGAAYDAYDVTVEIITTGTVATGEFRYRLDKASTEISGGTWSPVITIPSGGTYAIPNTNLTLTFVPGGGATFFEDGDVHTFSCTAPLYSTTDLANGVAAVGTEQFSFLGLVGTHASASDGATMFAALKTHMQGFENSYQYAGAIMEAGDDTPANIKTAAASLVDDRNCFAATYGTAVSAKPFVGWSVPRRSIAYDVIIRAQQATISDDLARFASGPSPVFTSIEYNEALTGTFSNTRVTAPRTFVGEPGIFINNAYMMSATGSDFRYWQNRRVMDVACFTAYKALLRFVSASVRTLTDGTGRIDPRDAARIDSYVNDALSVALEDPSNADGNPHVSGVKAAVDQTTNILQSGVLTVDVALVKLGYAKQINVAIGYATSLGGDA